MKSILLAAFLYTLGRANDSVLEKYEREAQESRDILKDVLDKNVQDDALKPSQDYQSDRGVPLDTMIYVHMREKWLADTPYQKNKGGKRMTGEIFIDTLLPAFEKIRETISKGDTWLMIKDI